MASVKEFVPGGPGVLANIRKVAAENKKRFSKSRRAAVAMLKREGILTKSGRIATKYR